MPSFSRICWLTISNSVSQFLHASSNWSFLCLMMGSSSTSSASSLSWSDSRYLLLTKSRFKRSSNCIFSKMIFWSLFWSFNNWSYSNYSWDVYLSRSWSYRRNRSTYFSYSSNWEVVGLTSGRTIPWLLSSSFAVCNSILNWSLCRRVV